MTNTTLPQVIPASTGLTVEQFRHCLPDNLKKTVNQELIDKINSTLSDPELYEQYRDNLMSYTKVLADGRFKMDSYISAVKYVSHKLMGSTDIDAYVKTFPDKYQDFLQRGVASKDIASYVCAYNKTKLVNLIREQSLIPSWVLNQDLYQKALNTQAELMLTAKSEKVRSDAANSLLTHLKQPETQKVQLDIGIKETSVVQDMRNAVQALAAAQRDQIRAGQATAQGVAHSKLVAEVVDVEVKEV